MTGMEILEQAQEKALLHTPQTKLEDLSLQPYKMSVQAVQLKQEIQLWHNDNWVCGSVDDWLVVHANDEIEVINNRIFKKRFVNAEDV